MDKNGNFKAQVNIPAQINIERTPGLWEPVRDLYITLVVKAKFSFNKTNPDDVVINITPKSVEMTKLVIKKGEEEVQMEQMMIQSLVNIQLEQVKKMFKNMPGKLNTLLKRIPKQTHCFGFNFTDIDLSYKKSQMQWTAYHTPVDMSSIADSEMCTKFYNDITYHQSGILKDLAGDKNPINKAMNTLFKDQP
jgi:hypothetical protein